MRKSLVPPLFLSPDLAAAKRSVKARIDAAAGRVIERLTSPHGGQHAIYREKEEQARAALAATDPSALEFPLLAQDIARAGDDVRAGAQSVIDQADAWRFAAAAIESARLGGKDAADAAIDTDALIAADAAAHKALAAIG